MQTLNMMKRKRVQVDDIQPLSRKGDVHVSNNRSNIPKVVGSRANCPKNINNMQFAEKGATKTLESRKNVEQIERGSILKINSNMLQVVGKRDSRFLENISNNELGSARKKTRGRLGLQLLHLQKEPIQVELNVLRQPIGEPGHKLGQYIGFIIKDSVIAPLNFEDWRYMPREIKICMYDTIKRQMDELITNQPDACKNEVFNPVIGEVSPEAHVSTLTYGLGINRSKKKGKRSSHLEILKMLEDDRIQRQVANEKISHLETELTELKSQLQTMEEMKSQFAQFKSMFEHQFSNSNASS
ncbi:hypothetical protein Dsin_012788 [Dipteronia sinensis]|uniref:Uncharacterized protein n=1 Tax=Dipteronia sinensis TaxID=43782 RepID=A0AAE0AIQ6_9ROSI|nr:hypothetical protein Dsin_012788 [Dipteronia sinensis]